MALSADLLSQVARAIAPAEPARAVKSVTGTAKEYAGDVYVQLDGSDQLTPIASSTAGMRDGDRVTVEIANHSARVTGNASDPAAGQRAVGELSGQVLEVGELVAGKADVGELYAQSARIDDLVTENLDVKERLTATEADIGQLTAESANVTGRLTAAEADIDDLTAQKADIAVLEADYATIASLEAVDADVRDLEADYADFKVASADRLTAAEASIASLDAEKLDAESADVRYATIDFANIGKAAIESFLSKSGMIGDLVVGEGTVTGRLVGVTIVGDLIEGGTVKADRLVVQGADGLYYKLNVSGETVAAEQTEYNSLSGSVITAQSITADKVSVTDLVAFGATIGGFAITEDALHSGAKSSVGNTTPGVYLDSSGQLAAGDQSSYLRIYEDGGEWHLEISADSISLGSQSIGSLFATKAELELTEEGIAQTVSAAQETAESALAQSSQAVQTAQGIAQEVEESYLPRDEAGELYASKSYVEQTADSITQAVESEYVSKTDAGATYSTKAELQQFSDSISAEVEQVRETADATATKAAQLEVSLDGVTTTVSEAVETAEGAMAKATEVEQTADSISSTVTGLDGRVSKVEQDASGFEVTLGQVQDTADGLKGSLTLFNGSFESGTTTGWTYNGANSPYVNTTSVYSGSYKLVFPYSSGGNKNLVNNSYIPVRANQKLRITCALFPDSTEASSSIGFLLSNGKAATVNVSITAGSWHVYTGVVTIPSGVTTARARIAWNADSAGNMRVDSVIVEDVTDAQEAAKTATNYLSFSSSGLVVGNHTGTLQGNVLLNSSGMQVRNGSTVYATYGANLIELGRNNSSSKIRICGGGVDLSYNTTNKGLSISKSTVVSGTVFCTQLSTSGVLNVNGNMWLGVGKRTQIRGFYQGTKVVNVDTTSTKHVLLFNNSQYTSIVGREYKVGDVILVSNGDYNAKSRHAYGTTYRGDNKNWYVCVESGQTGSMRINYLIVAVA